MAGRKAATRGKGKSVGSSSRSAIPEVYQQMLAEALPTQSGIPERPLKRRRTGRRDAPQFAEKPAGSTHQDDDDEEEEAEFEDVLGAQHDSEASDFETPAKAQQTAYRVSDEESDESDHEWEAVDFDTLPEDNEPSGDLELTLKPRTTPSRQKPTPRRRVVSKAEKVLRLEIHKMHVLCLLAHLDRRNEWCNDEDVKKSLKQLLDKKMLTLLKPKLTLSQFGRKESLRRGLEQVSVIWRTKFNITTRGTRRALWADNEKDIQNVRDFIKFRDLIHSNLCAVPPA
jgi:xeroderma pigmentosum group C-complementing protein